MGPTSCIYFNKISTFSNINYHVIVIQELLLKYSLGFLTLLINYNKTSGTGLNKYFKFATY